jgi:hypothetical protein
VTDTSRCEICGRRVEAGAELRYPRVGTDGPVLVASELRRCWVCKRLGCPDCLRAVEERADDFFIDLFTCPECQRKGED